MLARKQIKALALGAALVMAPAAGYAQSQSEETGLGTAAGQDEVGLLGGLSSGTIATVAVAAAVAVAVAAALADDSATTTGILASGWPESA